MKWHYGHEKIDRPQEPDYDKRIYSNPPPLTAFGNIQYRDVIKMIGAMWEGAHPEVIFRRWADNEEYNPEYGYIIYSLVARVPADNNAKPRMHQEYRKSDGVPMTAFIQSFMNQVRFSAMHRDPDVADEMIEEFEDFMMVAIPVLMKNGVEQIFYLQRNSDQNQSRPSQDMSIASMDWRIFTQKQFHVENAVIDDFFIRVSTVMGNDQATPSTPGVIECEPE